MQLRLATMLSLLVLPSCAAAVKVPGNALDACSTVPGQVRKEGYGYEFADDPPQPGAPQQPAGSSCIDTPTDDAAPDFDSVKLNSAVFDAHMVDVIELRSDGGLWFNNSSGPTRLLRATLTEHDRRLASAVFGDLKLHLALKAVRPCHIRTGHPGGQRIELVVGGQRYDKYLDLCTGHRIDGAVDVLEKLAQHYRKIAELLGSPN